MSLTALDKRIKHFSSLTKVEVNYFDATKKAFSPKHNASFCENCPKKCNYGKTHLYGCYEAVRWDNKYIYYCPLDLIFVAVPQFDEKAELVGGAIIGPLIMGESSDYEQTYGLPQMETSTVNSLAEIASATFTSNAVTGETKTCDFLNEVYKELEFVQEKDDYPIEIERELQNSIIDGNEAKARENLNKLLGEIFFRSGGDLKVIKARVVELVVLLSRSAIEGGADCSQIFTLNNDYIRKVDEFSSVEDLSRWLSGVIHRFVGYVFELKEVRHSLTMRRIIGYIRNNYMRKITLDEIAEQVYMSKSHVSKIFNEEMGVSLTAFINGVRVEKAKILLSDASLSVADIAQLTGFEDQSYFTKQFKLLTGLSPKKYREKLS